MEPGGMSDKLGNRYEGRWILKQMLRLLNEDIRCLQVESIGNEEIGVDLWVTQKDGTRQAHQCKAQYTGKTQWTIAGLNNRDILAYLKTQLQGDSSIQYFLVSGIPATAFQELTHRAHISTGNAEEFYEHQIRKQKSDNKWHKAFSKFCQYLQIDEESEQGRSKAFDLLQRSDFHLFVDNATTYDDLLRETGYLINGDPHSILALLLEYSQNNLRKRIEASHIRDYLTQHGFQPKQLIYDDRIGTVIEQLQQQFKTSIEPNLIGHIVIPREETQKVLTALLGDKSGAVVVIHGRAGIGKSGVLYELTQELQKAQIPYLPIRLDRKDVGNSTREFGGNLALPESPVRCLVNYAPLKSVLILDQLDALRWTSSHSAHAIDVCKALLREAYLERRLNGRGITVVLVSRTFDLEHDPGIKELLDTGRDQPTTKIVVEILNEDTVKEIVTKHGGQYDSLSSRQKEVLKSPNNLALWVAIRESCPQTMPAFRSATELMRRFWEDRYREIQKQRVSGEQIRDTLHAVAQSMENSGRLWARSAITEHDPQVTDLLQSFGIIQKVQNRIIFCHQSYLDYLIAQQVMNQVAEGNGSVIDWLGDKSRQSLFRREQLRQVLFMLGDENQEHLAHQARELLFSDNVRFHLKHLVLEVIGQIESPVPLLLEFSGELLENTEWTEHARSLLYFRHAPFISSLAGNEKIQQWLDSGDEDVINTALWLLRSIASTHGDFVAGLLRPYLSKEGHWAQSIHNTIWFNSEEDSPQTFELRLELARLGIVPDYVDWAKMTKHPGRAIQLIEAALSTWHSPKYEENRLTTKHRPCHFEHWNLNMYSSLKGIAQQMPDLVWNTFMPHIERLTAIDLQSYDTRLDGWLSDYSIDSMGDDDVVFSRGIVKLTMEAGKRLAEEDAGQFLGRIASFLKSISPVTQEIIAASLVGLPREQRYADYAVEWLLSDTRRFAIGAGKDEPEWKPAARIIKALSPHCSESNFRNLEDAITHFHSPQEKELAEYYLKRWREAWHAGHFGHFWGQAQHFLLPALCPSRRSNRVESLIGVLERKFEKLSDDDFYSSWRAEYKAVGSPLDTSRLDRISDKAWLDIVSNKDIRGDDRRWRENKERNYYIESTPRHFASDLQTIAKRFPKHFANLALQFPSDVHHSYLWAIIIAISETQPTQGTEEEKAVWEPVEMAAIVKLINRFNLSDERDIASAFCDLVSKRSDEQWPEEALDQLIRCARNHPDPELDTQNTYPSAEGNDIKTASVNTLFTNTINCVRGRAGQAIKDLLWAHSDLVEKFKPAIESLVNDPHPAVRMGGIIAAFPLLNLDRELAIDYFAQAVSDDLRVAATPHYAVYYFDSFERFHDQLKPLVLRMLDSNQDEVAQAGAREVFARWVFYDYFADELQDCIAGKKSHRMGVAGIAASFLANDRMKQNADYVSKSMSVLEKYFNDEDAEVRREASRSIHNNHDILKHQGSKKFVEEFLKSQAFRDDPTGVLFTLEHYPDSLLPFANIVFHICEEFAGPLAELTRNFALSLAGDASRISPLILRLYEQAEKNPVIRNRCLDAWDTMFENRVGMIGEMTKELDEY